MPNGANVVRWASSRQTRSPLASVAERVQLAYSRTNLVIALGGLIGFAVTYLLVLWLYVVPLGPPAFAAAAIAAAVWHARRGELEYGLLRHPFRRDLRPYLAQAIARLCFLGFLAVGLVGGTLGALDVLTSEDTARLVRIAYGSRSSCWPSPRSCPTRASSS